MIITIKSLNGKLNCQIEVYETTSIAELKEKTKRKLYLPQDDLCMFLFAGKMLIDNKTVQFYKIQNQSTVHLFIKKKTKIITIAPTTTATNQSTNDEIITVPVDVIMKGSGSHLKLSVLVDYSTATVRDLYNEIRKSVNKHYYPKVYQITKSVSYIEGSFYGNMVYYVAMSRYPKKLNDLTWCNPKYTLNDIVTIGVQVNAENIRQHKYTNDLLCKHIKPNDIDQKSNTNNCYDPFKCPIYSAMKKQYVFNKNNLQHIREYNHFKNEFVDKPSCNYGQSCNAFKRLENGGNRLDDNCHMSLFRHPPRTRNIELAKNIHSLIVNAKPMNTNPGRYFPTDDDKKEFNYNNNDGFIYALIGEVIKNGFKSDLCTKCKNNCIHNDHSLLNVVDKKINDIKHKSMDSPLNRAQMLSIILYTGCDCNYDLCGSQRKGNYVKWKWFDYILYSAIKKLSSKEQGYMKLYSGLQNVKLDKKTINRAYFVTYTSTTWIKTVALRFMGHHIKKKGMVIELTGKCRRNFICCDVQWISRFPDEYEVLVARSVSHCPNFFKIEIKDEYDGMQTVVMDKI